MLWKSEEGIIRKWVFFTRCTVLQHLLKHPILLVFAVCRLDFQFLSWTTVLQLASCTHLQSVIWLRLKTVGIGYPPLHTIPAMKTATAY
jgi:hypothetical protein